MSSGSEQPTGTSERDDAELLRAYVGGDEQAFEALVKRHFGLVHAVALRRVQDPSLAEEAAQSTSTEAGEIKAYLPSKQRQVFDYVYGADGLCLFQYLKVAPG